jgi:hypothetical protein
MQQRFDEIASSKADKSDIDRLKRDVNRVLEHLDALRDNTDADELERGALNLQVDRHEAWIEKASTAIGVRFSRRA